VETNVMVGGLTFTVRPYTSDLAILDEVISQDYYQLRALKASGVQLRTAIDVGAHIGAFTVLTKALWPACRVIAIEAGAENYLLLERNTRHLAGVHRIARAIAAKHGFARLASPAQVLQPGNTGAYRVTETGEHSVETCLLSEILQAYNSVDVLKFDCEGCEYIGLLDASHHNQLQKVHYILGEWHGADPSVLAHALGHTHRGTFLPNRLFVAYRY